MSTKPQGIRPMTKKLFHISATALLMVNPFCSGIASAADEHSSAAIQHADEAASSKDAQSVGEHAAEALKHIEAGTEAASSKSPERVKHLEAGKADLDAAVQHSKWYNTNSAINDAADGKAHLEAADK